MNRKTVMLALIAVGGLLFGLERSFQPREASLTEPSSADSDPYHQAPSSRRKDTRSSSRASVRGPAQTSVPITQRISDVRSCYETRACDYPQTDPRSYEFAVGQNLKSLLNEVRERARRREIGEEELASLGREFIRSYDGHVQAAALGLLEDSSPSEENLVAMTQGLLDSTDATVLERALPLLERYLGTRWETQVHAFFSALIVSGPHFSSQLASEHVLKFITPSSVETYQRALRSVPKGTKAASHLKSALDEYARLQTGA